MVAAIALSVALLISVVLVRIRQGEPAWMIYQRKGIEMRLKKLEAELARSRDEGRRGELQRKVDELRRRTPEVVEIRPFGTGRPERCMTCHFGIEDISPSHPNAVFGCTRCHGGQGLALDSDLAHQGLRGGRNPSRLEFVSVSCGTTPGDPSPCHSSRPHRLRNHADNISGSVMATAAGIINTLRYQWGWAPDAGLRYVAEASGRPGMPPRLPQAIGPPGWVSLPDHHYRTFCAVCHLGVDDRTPGRYRLAGCAACHAPMAPDGRYKGTDPTVPRDDAGHAAMHRFTTEIPDTTCQRCHNRSARTGLNYHGIRENEQYGTPYQGGGLNRNTLPRKRFFDHLVPDIHCEKGMACIDCHTPWDVMGSGGVYPHMQDQVEIRCEDCHGTFGAPPRWKVITGEDRQTIDLSRYISHQPLSEGERIALSSRGRPLVNVRTDAAGRSYLLGRLSGREHDLPVITGRRTAHMIREHGRLECDACHSAWSPQCYGCHEILDMKGRSFDPLSEETIPGRWHETRSYFRYAGNILGVNHRGRVAVMIPGCQVWMSVLGAGGRPLFGWDSTIMERRDGLTSLAFAPTHPHTVRREAPPCEYCHMTPKALGLGEGRMIIGPDGLTFSPLYRSRQAGLGIDFAPEALTDTGGDVLQGASRPGARPLTKEEIRRIIRVAVCIPCHNRYDDAAWLRYEPAKDYMSEPKHRRYIKEMLSRIREQGEKKRW